jgi:hypothetical protein
MHPLGPSLIGICSSLLSIASIIAKGPDPWHGGWSQWREIKSKLETLVGSWPVPYARILGVVIQKPGSNHSWSVPIALLVDALLGRNLLLDALGTM